MEILCFSPGVAPEQLIFPAGDAQRGEMEEELARTDRNCSHMCVFCGFIALHLEDRRINTSFC